MGQGFYRELTELLKAHGCTFVRAGRGSHEIWFSPITQINITIPRTTESRHTVNKVLKEAGLPKAF